MLLVFVFCSEHLQFQNLIVKFDFKGNLLDEAALAREKVMHSDHYEMFFRALSFTPGLNKPAHGWSPQCPHSTVLLFHMICRPRQCNVVTLTETFL